MATSRRTLTSLPSDVLHEILSHLLLDTPRAPRRAAILRTCSLLHDLGLPLLYRTVDLQSFSSVQKLHEQWEHLFGKRGVFNGGGNEYLGSLVREFRVGMSVSWSSGYWHAEIEASSEPLHLPNCSSLVLDIFGFDGSQAPFVQPILSQLPIETVRIQSLSCLPMIASTGPSSFLRCHSELMSRTVLGESNSPWETLRTVVFDGSLWYEKVDGGQNRLSLSDWSFKVLVVEVSPTKAADLLDAKVKRTLGLFLDPRQEGNQLLQGIERVEFRMKSMLARETENAYREEVRNRVARGLSSLERRLLPLFVFVSEDGTQGRFEDVE